jgi:cystathionine beta-lyase/cystathionine gamma-synthase
LVYGFGVIWPGLTSAATGEDLRRMNLDPADVALCVADDEPVGSHGPLPTSPPIVRTSLFSFPTFEALLDGFADDFHTTVYTRGKNPTVQLLESKLAKLERLQSQLRGYAGVFSFELVKDDVQSVGRVIDRLQRFRIGVSWVGWKAWWSRTRVGSTRPDWRRSGSRAG